MAIPLSDFYAFSSATGSPVPEDEESRARIAPQVAEWRRNQLKAPEQKSDFLSALGTGAAIAGLGAAALLGARALRRPQAVTQAAVRDVTPDVEQTVRRAATYRPEPQTPRPPRGTPAPTVEVTPPPSRVAQPPSRQPGGISQVDLYKLLETERPQGIVVTDIASLVQPKPQVRSETRLLPAATQKTDPMAFIGQYFEQKGTAAGSLTDFQRSLSNLMSDQAVNAVDAAEDQMTGRIKQQLQRNEDLDMSQVDLMEEVADYNYQQAMEQDEPDAPINQVAAQLPDGPPVDQAEGMLQRAISSGIKEGIDLRTGQRFLLVTKKPIEQDENTRRMLSQELADVAKTEMIARRQELVERNLRPGTMQFERALAQEWAAKPNLVPGSEEFNRQISMPTSIRKAVEVVEQLGEEEGLPVKFVRSVPNVGPLAEVTKTAAGTAIRGASPSYHEALPKVATRQLYGEPDVLVRGAPDELVPDLPAGLRIRGGIKPQIKEGDPGLSKQEIKFAVLDRPAEEQASGGSAGIGVYGLEPGYVPGAVSKATGEYSAAASRKPTEVPAWIEKQQRDQFSGVSDQGLLRAMEKSGRTGQIAIQNELDRRQRTRESIAASEVLRRARIEGRSPQEFLQTFEITQKPESIEQREFLKSKPVSTSESIYDLPMNFAYRGQAIPDTPATTFEAIQAGLRTSTLRKPGQVPSRVQPGARITAVGPQGQRQLLEVTGRRMVTPDMAEELSQVERWTPDFLRNYIGRVGGGKLEQITYRML